MPTKPAGGVKFENRANVAQVLQGDTEQHDEIAKGLLKTPQMNSTLLESPHTTQISYPLNIQQLLGNSGLQSDQLFQIIVWSRHFALCQVYIFPAKTQVQMIQKVKEPNELQLRTKLQLGQLNGVNAHNRMNLDLVSMAKIEKKV